MPDPSQISIDAFPSQPGIAIVVWAARAAFGFYLLSESIRIAKPHPNHIFRLFWTLGYAAFLLHLWAAFEFVHDWSHAAAFAETARRTHEVVGLNWGGGLWVNYLFLIFWTIDVVSQWSSNLRTQVKSRLQTCWRGFAAFIWFNAAVVFVPRQMSLYGIAGFLILGTIFLRRHSVRT